MIRVIKTSSSKLKNPTDKNFLRQIRIEKFDNGVFIRYDIIYKNKPIGVFVLRPNTNFIEDADIFDEQYHRKGLASYVYDYIEKDLGIKLKPSKSQTSEGYSFWQNRLKTRVNPTDYSFLRLLKIEKRILNFSSDSTFTSPNFKDNIMYKYVVKLRGKTIAYAEIFENANYVEDVQIYDEKYRRKGLATYLYDYIERDLRRKLKPSPFLLKDGEKFWENRNKRKNV